MQPDDPSPAWRDRLIHELDGCDQRAVALVRALTPAQLNWKPGPDRWSIGQCLEHLCVMNDVYLPPIARALDGRPPGAAQEITPGWFARWFIRSYIAPSETPKRAPAPKSVVPGSRVDASVVDRFLAGNRTVREVIDRARHHDVNRIRFVNPFISVIRFTVGSGLEIISKHEQRHLLQAERVRALPQFPKAG